MRTTLLISIAAAGILLAGCSAPPTEHGMHDMDSIPTVSYAIDNQSTGSGIAFFVLDKGQPLTTYTITHTKPLHLLIVRDDLTHFYHLHPVMGSGGLWSVPFTPDAAGTYWVYADFTDTHGVNSVQRFAEKYEGTVGAYGLTPNLETTKTVDGLSVHFSPVFNGKEATLAFEVSRKGKPVVLEDYLGAKGHAVVLTTDGQYLHTHADSNDLSFKTTLPASDAFYRIFLQFQTDGTVRTVNFDIVDIPTN